MDWINNLTPLWQFTLFSAIKIICVFSVLMFIVAYAVDANGHEIRWNHLGAEVTIVNYRDGTALTYKSGDTLWVNYTRNPESIDDGDIMVMKRFSPTTLCRTDHIELVDRLSGMFSGVLFLDEFVPYKKVDAEG